MSLERPSWPALLDSVIEGHHLSDEQSTALMRAWLAEELTPVQTGGFLTALRAKGLVSEELAAMAAFLSMPASVNGPIPMVDNCGPVVMVPTPSTAVAFAVAACGVSVAKHGQCQWQVWLWMFWRVWSAAQAPGNGGAGPFATGVTFRSTASAR